MKYIIPIILILILLSNYVPAELNNSDNWDSYARIAGGFEDEELFAWDGTYHDPLEMSQNDWDDAMNSLASQGVNTVDLDLGLYYYETFMDPSTYITAIKKAAIAAHDAGLRIFTYQAGLELQTTDADKKDDTVYKTHPDWLQRGVDGEYAKYDSSFAFWIDKGDEDVWVTPLNMQWRTQYMNVISQLASTGIDAIYIDVPYFVDWTFSWGSFDTYMKSEFKSRTGMDAPTKDQFSMDNDNFRAWLNFRNDVIMEFLQDVKSEINNVNANTKLFVEVYGGYSQYGVINAADDENVVSVVDGVTHEFGLYDDDASSAYTTDNWLFHSAVLQIMRGIDNNKPTWMLQYGLTPDDSLTLAAATIAAGANFWETKAPGMLSSTGAESRKKIFDFIKENENYLYSGWKIEHPVLLYYSSTTKTVADALADPIVDSSSWDDATGEDYLNYFAGPHIQDLIGISMSLMRHKVPIQIVTKSTITDYLDYDTPLIIPSVSAISDAELNNIKKYNGKIITSGTVNVFDENGNTKNNDLLANYSFDNAIGIDILKKILNNHEYSQQEQDLIDVLTDQGYTSPITVDQSYKDTIILPYYNSNNHIIRIFNYKGVEKNNQIPDTINVNFSYNGKDFSVPVQRISLLDPSNNQIIRLNNSTVNESSNENLLYFPTYYVLVSVILISVLNKYKWIRNFNNIKYT